MLEIRLVGAVEASRAGQPVALPGRRVRALLGLLALAPGDTVSTGSLVTGIWDDDPPDHVRGSLQTYVGRLRRVLGDKAIETRPTGYALLVPRSAVDLLVLWDSVLAARDASDPGSERAALAGVLERWNGEPLGDAPSEWLARHERSVWVERRLQTFERWVDLSFEAGDHQACLEQLNGQAERHPLREPLWTRLLIALDRVGRTAEALDRYESVRKRLAEELGVDPSPALRAVHATLLERSDEHADLVVGGPPPIVPRQLPAPIGGFVGRADRLSVMDGVLARAEGEHGGALLALHGPAGSGKTTLALHWAHRVKGGFPDGQLFLDLQGYGPGEPMSTGRSLGVLLRGLGVPGERIPDDIDERSAMLRSETEGRRLLVVLDNARESEQVRSLLPGSDAFVLVTSRTQLRGLVTREAAHRVRVDPMSVAESVALLERRLTGETEVEESALAELAGLCGHLPVALAVAAERVGRHEFVPHPVEAIITELRDHKHRLDALSSDDDPLTSVRAVLDWSYRSLDDESARVMRLLGLYTAPLISTGAVTALAGSDSAGVSRAIDRLTDRHLLVASGDGYYRMHDLVRDYAAEISLEGLESERSTATKRLRSWCLHSTAQARATWESLQYRRLPDLESSVIPEHFSSARDAATWFDTHAAYLNELITTCVADYDPVGHLLAPIVSGLTMKTRGFDRDDLVMLVQAEERARTLGDAEGQADCANSIAVNHFNRADAEAAIEAVIRARDLYAHAGVSRRELWAQGNLAVALARGGREAESAREHKRAVEKAHEVATPTELGRFLCNASDFYLSVGRLEDAVSTAEEALAVVESVDEPGAILPLVLENLGETRAVAGRLSDAVGLMDRAVENYRSLQMRGDEANALVKLGTCHRDLGQPREARRCWSEAARILDEIGIQQTRDISGAELNALLADLDGPVSDE